MPSTGGSVVSPKTPITPFRIPPKLKTAAVEKAKTEDRTLTSVVIEKLEEYVTRELGSKISDSTATGDES